MANYIELNVELSEFIEKIIINKPLVIITPRYFIFFKYDNVNTTEYNTIHEFNKFNEGQYEIDEFFYEIRSLLRKDKITKLKSK